MHTFDCHQWEFYGARVHAVLRRSFSNQDGLWYEAPDEVRQELRRGQNRARLLRWVRVQMVLVLTEDERLSLERHFFQGLSYRETSRESGVHLSSVYRTAQRAIRKLRRQAEADGGMEGILAAGQADCGQERRRPARY